MMSKDVGAQVRSQSARHCVVCGAEGKDLYTDLEDALFGATGRWKMRQCVTPWCRTLWLDPRPADEDLAGLYKSYYTHDNAQGAQGFYRRLVAWHVYRRFGGVRPRSEIVPRLGSLVFWLHPGRRIDVEARVMGLPVICGGSVLEVGFGSGETLDLLNAAGWRAQGIDFDEAVVERGRKRGLNVSAGSLEEQGFPAEHFDAIVMSHVIEHLTDPPRTLKECLRILKPGGRLVVYTPNARSLGSRVFGRCWRGLEPPRHLNVFSVGGLASLAGSTGFQVVRSTASGRGGHMLCESIGLSLRGAAWRPPRLVLELAMTLSWAIARVVPGMGEEIGLVAAKPARGAEQES